METRKTLAANAIATLCATLFFSASSAQPAAAAGDGAQVRKGPRPEAVAACKSLAAAQACTFEAPRGTVNGTCIAREGKPLACRPSDAPPRGEGKSQAKQ